MGNQQICNKWICSSEREKTAVRWEKIFFVSETSYSSNNLEKSCSYFSVMVLYKEKGKKTFLFRRVFVWYLTQCQSQVRFYMLCSMLYVLVLCPLLTSSVSV